MIFAPTNKSHRPPTTTNQRIRNCAEDLGAAHVIAAQAQTLDERRRRDLAETKRLLAKINRR